VSTGEGEGLGDLGGQGQGDTTVNPTLPDTPVPRVTLPAPAPPEVEGGEDDDQEGTEGGSGGGSGGSGGGQRIPGLVELLVLLLLIALAGALKSLADFFNWLFRKFLGPLYGRAGSPSVDPSTLGQGLTSTFGDTFAGLDPTIGSAFHQLGADLARLGQTLYGGTVALRTLARRLVGLEHRVAAGHTQQQAQQQHAQQQDKRQQTQGQHISQLQRTLDQEKNDVEQQMQAVITHITKVLEPELEQQRKQIGTLKKGHVSIWGELEKQGEQLGLEGLTAGVATALGVLGASWTRCENTRTVGEALCGSNSTALKDLLEGLLDIGLLLNLCYITELLVSTAESGVVQDLFAGFADGLEALLACRGITPYTPPSVAAADLSPTVLGFAQLAPVL
jgi:hypothetical protein